jgi:5-methyltetrahydrofolate--homocysteine methyltransferase
MAHVASEMQREGFEIPLLIGGATTSRAHTAIKIAPHYGREVVHVLDASRAVGVVGSLLSDDLRTSFIEENRRLQAELREQHANRQDQHKILSLEEARARAPRLDWSAYQPPKPSFTGVRVLDDFPLEKLVPFIDWTPFFHAWELRGRYPQILEDEVVGERAKEVLADAQVLLKRIVEEKLIRASGVYGFWPANRVGDDVRLFTDESRSEALTTLYSLRQQIDKRQEDPTNYALADFVAPEGQADYVGAFAVTAGHGVLDLVMQFKREHDDYNAIMAEAIADRFAEAFAEYLHKQAREDWGYGQAEGLSNEELIREQYRGIRPAPGYPACPDHTEKRTIFDLLRAEANSGIELTESYAMAPGASVSGLYFSHPESRYFNVGRIGRDQVEEYARRKGLSVQEVERWLSPNLGYNPA